MANEDCDLPFGLCKYDVDFLKSFHISVKDLRSLTISNIEFYQRGRSSIHARYYATSCILLERTQVLEPIVIDIVPKLKDFDFSPEVQANGYRSFINIVYRCCLHLLQLCRHIYTNKSSLLFRSSHYLKELDAYVETLGQLIACLGYLQQLISHSCHGNLFLDDNPEVGDELLLEVEMLNTDCFYGRCLGFQFCESMQKVLQGVLVVMATYSECYEESSQMIQLASSILNGSKYVVDQDLRAKQVVDVTRTADIKFCKAFWSIPESPLLHQIRLFTFPHVEVSELISLPPDNFELPQEGSTNDETVMITPPCAHTGPSSVTVRLISHIVRDGMEVTRRRFQPKTGSFKPTIAPRSPCLLFHCHGGGFVAQSSQAHENYLRVWARQLEVPILSVDYSLAPDAPFPRALEECFYAYAWALKHHDRIGWTGERVCFAGDSAGGNLVMSTALRAISYQIRIPDGIMAAYTPFLVQYKPSPARLMSMIDPLLPVGILTRCLAAYAGIADQFSSALTKPIFCNPGDYESWEIVEEQDVKREPIGQVVTNAVDSYHESYKLANEDCPCNTCCSHDGACNMSDLTDSDDDNFEKPGLTNETLAVVPDSESQPGTVKGSTETNDEVINQNSLAKSTDENVEMEKGLHRNQVKSLDIKELVTVSGEGETNMVSDFDSNTVSHTEVEENQRRNVDECSERMKNELNMDIADAKTVSEAISKIDSNVKVVIDDSCMEDGIKVENEPCMAECQEILEEKELLSSLPHGEISKDMYGGSCHSLPDLINDETSHSVEIPEKNIDKSNQVDKLGTILPKDGKETQNNEKSFINMTKIVAKQGSVSDNSDSGIHGDMNEDVTCSAVSTKPMHKHLTRTDCVQKGDEMVNGKELQSEGNKGLVDPSDRKSGDASWTSRMSLGLSVRYHPGTGESPERLSPESPRVSPVSPKLPSGSRSFTPKMYSVHRKIAQSPIQLFRQLPIVKNYYMSPILAPDDLITELPEVHLVACHFDPLLDDSIMFAKKLAALDKSVSLKVFDHLPHGFLSFSDASPEAKKASNFCLKKISEVLKLSDSTVMTPEKETVSGEVTE